MFSSILWLISNYPINAEIWSWPTLSRGPYTVLSRFIKWFSVLFCFLICCVTPVGFGLRMMWQAEKQSKAIKWNIMLCHLALSLLKGNVIRVNVTAIYIIIHVWHISNLMACHTGWSDFYRAFLQWEKDMFRCFCHAWTKCKLMNKEDSETWKQLSSEWSHEENISSCSMDKKNSNSHISLFSCQPDRFSAFFVNLLKT